MMKVRAALKLAFDQLINSPTPALDARLLVSYAMNVSYERLLLNYNQELSQGIKNTFLELLSRRQGMEPMAYILGKQEFYGLELIVNKSVLIPRPDTELLIDIMIEECRTISDQEISILELGTGSGAIAVALAKSIITSNVTAVDISNSALEVAQENASKHNVSNQIQFVQSDWYQNLDSKKYDYIISNPPYIALEEQAHMAKETLMFEPHLALYAENNGLQNYEIIIESAKNHLNPNGKLLLEIGYSQKEALSQILQTSDFTVRVRSDLAGLDRVIIAKCAKKDTVVCNSPI